MFLKQYLHQRRKILLISTLFFVIWLASFYLYHLPLLAILYPALICLVIGAVILCCDYRKAKQRHKCLLEISRLTAELITELPAPQTIEDEDNQRIIRMLCHQQIENTEKNNMRYRKMVEYYTIWGHQIKTPVASMRLHLQNEDSAFSRKLAGDLNRIEQYVEMVMVFLRLDSESTDYVFRECDLDEIIKQSLRRFSGEFIGRKLSLTYTPTEMDVMTDKKWLSFVIEQIISNALKYTPDGGITVKKDRENTLLIKDTGIGIAAEDLPRIFERGYTGFNGQKNKRASGIGLYLCKRICGNLGIEITASSSPNDGTEIRLVFPKALPNAE